VSSNEDKGLRVPAAYRGGMVLLVSLTLEQRRELVDFLAAAQPKLDAAGLSTDLAKRLHINEEDAEGLLQLLASLFPSFDRAEVSAENFAASLLKALAASEPELVPVGSDIDGATACLKEILAGTNALRVSTRAQDLLTESCNRLVDARVLLDARPIYVGEPQEPPSAAVLIHNLRIAYASCEGTSEFFVAMNSSDLQGLREVIDRALQKEEGFRLSLQNGGMRVVE
jgi:hypothetical protein